MGVVPVPVEEDVEGDGKVSRRRYRTLLLFAFHEFYFFECYIFGDIGRKHQCKFPMQSLQQSEQSRSS